MAYEIQLVEEKVKQQQVTALHLICALAFIGAGVIIFVYNYVIPYWGLGLLLAGALLLAASMARNKWVTTPRHNVVIRMAELAIAAAVAIYSAAQQWSLPIGIFAVLGAVVAFALYWEGKMTKPKMVAVGDEGISLPVASRRRFIPWTEIEQVLLRFGTLSIDCVDNTLFQWNVQEGAAGEADFEAFCKQQIESHRAGRKNNDW